MSAFADKYLRLIWLHILILVVCLGVAVFFVVTLPTLYRSQALLLYEDAKVASLDSTQQITPDFSSSGLSTLLGEERSQSQLQQILALMKTRDFLVSTIAKKNLLPLIFPELWQSSTNSWKPNLDKVPTSTDGYGRLADNIYTYIDPKSQIITYGVAARTPQASLELTNTILQAFNRAFRTEHLEDSGRTLSYIESQEESTTNVDVKSLLLSLHRQELRRRILLAVEPNIPFKVVDRPILSRTPYRPNKKLIFLVAAAAAITLSFFLTMIWPPSISPKDIFTNVKHRLRLMMRYSDDCG